MSGHQRQRPFKWVQSRRGIDVILVAAGILTWLLVGPSLAWLMRPRGHDPVPWLLLGLIWAPLAVILAFAELVWPTSYSPRVLTPAKSSREASTYWSTSIPHHDRWRPQPRPWLTYARGCAPWALGVPGAQVVLLFGRPGTAPPAVRRQRQLLTGGQHRTASTRSRPASKRSGSRRSDGRHQSPDHGSTIESPIRPYPSSPRETGSDAQKPREEAEVNLSPYEPHLAFRSRTSGQRPVTDTRSAP